MRPDPHPVIVIGAGQSGLAAAHALRSVGLPPLVLEAGERPTGSWSRYYDSLHLFSPAGYSNLPGLPFGGDPDRYPGRDEVVQYLARFAEHLDVEIRTRTTVRSVEPDGDGFLVHTTAGDTLPTSAVVAASGSFSRPFVPELGQDGFSGQVLHSADYRNPSAHTGARVVVVGGGNSGVQIADELTAASDVTLATRAPVTFTRQRIGGRDLHHWLKRTGFDLAPPAVLRRLLRAPLVIDTGAYREAVSSGRLERRPMFTRLDGDAVVWSDGSREHVDTVILATGYRPALEYLHPLGALTGSGAPLHSGGTSTTRPGLVYTGLELQRTFSSNTLRGVGRDAGHVARALATHVRRRSTVVG
ncbi:flavin-containing monooxygenase [Oerskovia flava]|uniref:flavin-containing monooxygenase n=1 Tax=Oerskovia flava TaxID=2986422 RepID=UPI00224033F2|nr:NAD(P)/FAD-dependent oxidoreductase [Oerskovia sp. JB1-3-2]